MTTLLLPADEIAKLRVMKGLAYMLAVMITLDRHYPGRGFTPEQVAMVAGMDARTASKQLQDLSTLDRVILSKGGYVLTQGGRALFLAPANDEALALSPENSQALEAQALNSVTDVQTVKRTEDASNTHAACALLKKKEEGDSFSNLETDSTSSTSEVNSAQSLRDGEWPSVRAILEATPDLFGEPGVLAHGLELESITPWMALAWIAHGWDQWVEGGKHGNLFAPAGVVHNRLKSGQKPRPIYYNSGWEILPDGFMEALGLRNYPCECGQVFLKRAEYDEHVRMLFCCEYRDNNCELRFHSMEAMEAHVEKYHAKPNNHELAALESSHAGSQAWQRVLEALQMEMPRASFDTWVRDARAVEYDGKVLTVSVRNAYCRDWLDSRLTSTVQRLLVGILNSHVSIRFIVADGSEE